MSPSELTKDELAALVAARADVELLVLHADGVKKWVPAWIIGRTPSGIVHLEIKRANGSTVEFSYPERDARRIIRRIALSRFEHPTTHPPIPEPGFYWAKCSNNTPDEWTVVKVFEESEGGRWVENTAGGNHDYVHEWGAKLEPPK